MEAWAHPADDALDFGYSGERGDRVLRSGGSVVATVAFPEDATPTFSIDGRRWHLESYGRGWRFALLREDREDPDAWFTGGVGALGSGRITVAPDREYRFRSGPLVRRWRVTEGRTELVRIQPDGNDLRVRPVAVPSTPADAPLLIVLACTIVTLQQMQPSMGDGGVS